MRFVDRSDAGRRLGFNLAAQGFERPLVFALPRGGVPVATHVADALRAPLDVLVVRTLAYPQDPEIGMGAIAEGGVRLMVPDLMSRLDVTPEQIEGVASVEDHELRRRVRRYRGDRPALQVAGRTVILVDDGVVSGFTARAAIDVLRQRTAAHIVLAVPVGPAHTIASLRDHADQVTCLYAPRSFTSLRQWYDDFSPVSDTQVAELLDAYAAQDA